MPLLTEDLRARLAESETRFNSAKIRKDQLQAQLEAQESECLRIQGEYRLLQTLVDESDKKFEEVEDAKSK